MEYHKMLRRIKGGAKNAEAFSNIAEGTHAGSITLTAAEDIDASYLLVKMDDSGNAVEICQAADMPLGVCLDESDINSGVAVALPASSGSTLLCRCDSGINAGDAVFTSSAGKITAAPANGSYKVGVALTSSVAGGIVEVDPQNFGARAFAIAQCGTYVWTGSTAEETLANTEVSEDDIVFATISAKGGSEKTVVASVVENGIKFKLDAAGTASTTKVSWIIINK